MVTYAVPEEGNYPADAASYKLGSVSGHPGENRAEYGDVEELESSLDSLVRVASTHLLIPSLVGAIKLGSLIGGVASRVWDTVSTEFTKMKKEVKTMRRRFLGQSRRKPMRRIVSKNTAAEQGKVKEDLERARQRQLLSKRREGSFGGSFVSSTSSAYLHSVSHNNRSRIAKRGDIRGVSVRKEDFERALLDGAASRVPHATSKPPSSLLRTPKQTVYLDELVRRETHLVDKLEADAREADRRKIQLLEERLEELQRKAMEMESQYIRPQEPTNAPGVSDHSSFQKDTHSQPRGPASAGVIPPPPPPPAVMNFSQTVVLRKATVRLQMDREDLTSPRSRVIKELHSTGPHLLRRTTVLRSPGGTMEPRSRWHDRSQAAEGTVDQLGPSTETHDALVKALKRKFAMVKEAQSPSLLDSIMTSPVADYRASRPDEVTSDVSDQLETKRIRGNIPADSAILNLVMDECSNAHLHDAHLNISRIVGDSQSSDMDSQENLSTGSPLDSEEPKQYSKTQMHSFATSSLDWSEMPLKPASFQTQDYNNSLRFSISEDSILPHERASWLIEAYGFSQSIVNSILSNVIEDSTMGEETNEIGNYESVIVINSTPDASAPTSPQRTKMGLLRDEKEMRVESNSDGDGDGDESNSTLCCSETVDHKDLRQRESSGSAHIDGMETCSDPSYEADLRSMNDVDAQEFILNMTPGFIEPPSMEFGSESATVSQTGDLECEEDDNSLDARELDIGKFNAYASPFAFLPLNPYSQRAGSVSTENKAEFSLGSEQDQTLDEFDIAKSRYLTSSYEDVEDNNA